MNTAQSFNGGHYTGWIEGSFTWPAAVNPAVWKTHDTRPETDRDVLEAMSGREFMSVAEISKEAELARGATEGALRRLKDRGLAAIVRYERPQLWRLV